MFRWRRPHAGVGPEMRSDVGSEEGDLACGFYALYDKA